MGLMLRVVGDWATLSVSFVPVSLSFLPICTVAVTRSKGQKLKKFDLSIPSSPSYTLFSEYSVISISNLGSFYEFCILSKFHL